MSSFDYCIKCGKLIDLYNPKHDCIKDLARACASPNSLDDFKAKQDFSAALEIVEDSIDKIKDGKSSYIRPMSTQLYILLVDRGKGAGPLVNEFVSDFQLHPIKGSTSENGQKPDLELIRELMGSKGCLFLSIRVNFEKGRPVETYMFDESGSTIPLKEWLDQHFMNYDITILALLKSIRNKMGAHSDVSWNDILKQTRTFYIGGFASDVLGMLAVSEYVIKQIKLQTHRA